ncbi:MAG: flagellar assembly protein T N-terminal domain-containing protein [Sumerlaeia bacterium]
MRGDCEETGAFVLFVATTGASEHLSSDSQRELLRSLVQREAALFLGQDVSAWEEISEVSSTIASADGSTRMEYESRLTSLLRTETKQLLAGMRFLPMVRDGQTISMGALVAEKELNAFPASREFFERGRDGAVEVVAVGVAMVVKDGSGVDRIDEARRQAINGALREAITQVLGTTLAATNQVHDLDDVRSKIFTTAFGSVDQYEVLAENREQGTYRVEIRARVTEEALLADYGSLMASMGSPEFFVESPASDELRQRFSSFLADLQIPITAKRASAAYIIGLNGSFDPLEHPVNRRRGTQLNLHVTVRDAATGRQLLVVQNNPRYSAVFTGTAARQHDLAAGKAFSQIREELHQGFQDLLTRMAISGREIVVVFENYSSACQDSLPTIGDSLRMIPGVTDFDLSAMNEDRLRGEVVFKVRYAGKIDVLSDLLREDLAKRLGPEACPPKLQSQSANRLVMTF